MNKQNLLKVFDHYISQFERINAGEHIEYYKWQVCEQFPRLMKKALAADDLSFAQELNEARKCTWNVIDSYTQPFSGLVELAKKEPQAVRQLLLNLYADDGGDINVQMELIREFFARSAELTNKYFPNSFRFKQDAHSVSALLFLNDPDHHYMYKAVQSKYFAETVEFYEDFGTGENIKLDVYYRMCDEFVAAIKKCPELMDTDQSRFDGRLKISGGKLHPDTEKHILAFDIMYCLSTYSEISSGIEFTKRTLKEKQLYLEMKNKAELLWQDVQKAREDNEKLEAAKQAILSYVKAGKELKHLKYGNGTVVAVNGINADIRFGEETKQLNLLISAGNGIVFVDNPTFESVVKEYQDVLKKSGSIPRVLAIAESEFEPYQEYLE